VGYARNRGISARRACALLAVSRSTLGYCSRMATKDEPIKAAMRELSGQYPRFGYRRIQVFLERRGLPMSADRAYRIWSAEGLHQQITSFFWAKNALSQSRNDELLQSLNRASSMLFKRHRFDSFDYCRL
jgi:hypothetical protein